VSS
ncbi:molybdopterin oxidoreductase family protein, partial [Vibrio parahaemolyticus V-223/04]|jgi:hypothetical protein